MVRHQIASSAVRETEGNGERERARARLTFQCSEVGVLKKRNNSPSERSPSRLLATSPSKSKRNGSYSVSCLIGKLANQSSCPLARRRVLRSCYLAPSDIRCSLSHATALLAERPKNSLFRNASRCASSHLRISAVASNEYRKKQAEKRVTVEVAVTVAVTSLAAVTVPLRSR